MWWLHTNNNSTSDPIYGLNPPPLEIGLIFGSVHDRPCSAWQGFAGSMPARTPAGSTSGNPPRFTTTSHSMLSVSFRFHWTYVATCDLGLLWKMINFVNENFFNANQIMKKRFPMKREMKTYLKVFKGIRAKSNFSNQLTRMMFFRREVKLSFFKTVSKNKKQNFSLFFLRKKIDIFRWTFVHNSNIGIKTKYFEGLKHFFSHKAEKFTRHNESITFLGKKQTFLDIRIFLKYFRLALRINNNLFID